MNPSEALKHAVRSFEIFGPEALTSSTPYKTRLLQALMSAFNTKLNEEQALSMIVNMNSIEDKDYINLKEVHNKLNRIRKILAKSFENKDLVHVSTSLIELRTILGQASACKSYLSYHFPNITEEQVNFLLDNLSSNDTLVTHAYNFSIDNENTNDGLRVVKLIDEAHLNQHTFYLVCSALEIEYSTSLYLQTLLQIAKVKFDISNQGETLSTIKTLFHISNELNNISVDISTCEEKSRMILARMAYNLRTKLVELNNKFSLVCLNDKDFLNIIKIRFESNYGSDSDSKFSEELTEEYYIYPYKIVEFLFANRTISEFNQLFSILTIDEVVNIVDSIELAHYQINQSVDDNQKKLLAIGLELKVYNILSEKGSALSEEELFRNIAEKIILYILNGTEPTNEMMQSIHVSRFLIIQFKDRLSCELSIEEAVEMANYIIVASSQLSTKIESSNVEGKDIFQINNGRDVWQVLFKLNEFLFEKLDLNIINLSNKYLILNEVVLNGLTFNLIDKPLKFIEYMKLLFMISKKVYLYKDSIKALSESEGGHKTFGKLLILLHISFPLVIEEDIYEDQLTQIFYLQGRASWINRLAPIFHYGAYEIKQATEALIDMKVEQETKLRINPNVLDLFGRVMELASLFVKPSSPLNVITIDSTSNPRAIAYLIFVELMSKAKIADREDVGWNQLSKMFEASIRFNPTLQKEVLELLKEFRYQLYNLVSPNEIKNLVLKLNLEGFFREQALDSYESSVDSLGFEYLSENLFPRITQQVITEFFFTRAGTDDFITRLLNMYNELIRRHTIQIVVNHRSSLAMPAFSPIAPIGTKETEPVSLLIEKALKRTQERFDETISQAIEEKAEYALKENKIELASEQKQEYKEKLKRRLFKILSIPIDVPISEITLSEIFKAMAISTDTPVKNTHKEEVQKILYQRKKKTDTLEIRMTEEIVEKLAHYYLQNIFTIKEFNEESNTARKGIWKKDTRKMLIFYAQILLPLSPKETHLKMKAKN